MINIETRSPNGNKEDSNPETPGVGRTLDVDSKIDKQDLHAGNKRTLKANQSKLSIPSLHRIPVSHNIHKINND